ncbi:MAG: CPBP family intramembrane glutamic endopeptidase [Turicibacter sp.]
MDILSLVMSSIVQVILFSVIPFSWWWITHRKKQSFFSWIGLKKPIMSDKKSLGLTLVIISGLYVVTTSVILPFFVNADELATQPFTGLGISGLVHVLVYSFIQTGLSEELLFRGFLAKRLISKLGFKRGNLIQATLFGLMHGFMLMSFTGTIGCVLAIFITGGIGWLLGWVNEEKAQGSIYPSWMIHGGANLITSTCALFNIL